MSQTLVILFIVVVILSLSIVSVYAQQESEQNDVLTIATNKVSYSEGETILIHGKVPKFYADTPLTIQIISNTGDIVKISQVYPENDGGYADSVSIKGSQWQIEGKYIIKSFYGVDNIAETTFFVTLEKSTEPTPEPGSSVQEEPETYSPTLVPETEFEELEEPKKKIPEWVRNIFIWYAEGKITEDDLISAIQFLVNEGIISLTNNRLDAEIARLENDRNYLLTLKTEQEAVTYLEEIVNRPNTVNTCNKILDRIDSIRNENWDFNFDGTITQNEMDMAYQKFGMAKIENTGKMCLSMNMLFPEKFTKNNS